MSFIKCTSLHTIVYCRNDIISFNPLTLDFSSYNTFFALENIEWSSKSVHRVSDDLYFLFPAVSSASYFTKTCFFFF